MSIKSNLARFDQKCVCSPYLPESLIIHVQISELHVQWALMFTLQHGFEISTLPSISCNGHVGDLC